MVLLEETLNKAVRDAINLIVGSDVAIKAQQRAPRPDYDHVTVNIVSINKVGWEEILDTDRTIDPDIDRKSEGYRDIMYSLNFYGDTSYDVATKVYQGLVRNEIYEFFTSADLGLLGRSDVRNISQALDDGWERRAQFDFNLSAVGTDEEIIRSIQIVSISGDFQTRGISVPINIEV